MEFIVTTANHRNLSVIGTDALATNEARGDWNRRRMQRQRALFAMNPHVHQTAFDIDAENFHRTGLFALR